MLWTHNFSLCPLHLSIPWLNLWLFLTNWEGKKKKKPSWCTKGLPWWLSWYIIHLQCRRPRFNSWVGKIRWRRDRLPTPVFLGFPGGSAGKESSCNEGDLGSIPGLGRCPGEGKGYPLQYSGLENSMDYTVHGVAKSQTWLSTMY